MAPASKRASKKSGVVEEAPEALLQAVIIADSFNKRFRPLTLDKPRCLLPLANTPIIEYTLEFLALGGVEEVFLYCHSHSDKITEYIKNSRWSRASSPFEIHVIHSPSIMSVGDVMRELDQTRLIQNDFVLVAGDIVSNISLRSILQEHKARRLVDKNCIMTSVLREVSPDHRSRPLGENALFALDSDRKRILHYEYLKQSDTEHAVHLPRDLVKPHPTMGFQENFVDCCIDIVSFEVPPLFTENFDWQHSRKDFLHGILMDELYGKTVYAHILKHGYAGRIQSLNTYAAISEDIIHRWTNPFCPDSNFLSDQTFKYSKGNVYKEAKVILAQSAVIGGNTIIGSGTSVGDGTVIVGSTIGRNCIIGKNVKLDSAIIWDNVSIGDNCDVSKCIIASDACIGDKCTIDIGAIISYGVVVEKGTHIPSSAKYTRYSPSHKDEEGSSGYTRAKTNTLNQYEDSEDDEEEQTETSMGSLHIEEPHEDLENSEISEFEDDSETGTKKKKGHVRHSSESEADLFVREAYNSLLGALKQNHSVDIMILELNGLRMSSNAEFNDVRRATAAAVITHTLTKVTSNETMAKTIDGIMEKLLPLYNRMIFDVRDQAELLGFMQKELAGKERAGAIMQAIGMKLYNEDLCDNEGILAWWNDGKGPEGETPEMAKVREATKAFVKWVEAQQEESEEEDSEEEDDDDE